MTPTSVSIDERTWPKMTTIRDILALQQNILCSSSPFLSSKPLIPALPEMSAPSTSHGTRRRSSSMKRQSHSRRSTPSSPSSSKSPPSTRDRIGKTLSRLLSPRHLLLLPISFQLLLPEHSHFFRYCPHLTRFVITPPPQARKTTTALKPDS